MGAYYANPMIFLIETIGGLYVLAVMLRFLLQWTNADFYNPVCQFLVKITHPPLKLLRRVVPAIGRVDTASILLLLVLQMLIGILIFNIQGAPVALTGLLMWSFTELLTLLLNIFLFSVFLLAILSWVNPGYNPSMALLNNLTEPLLRIARQVLPPISGVDLSVLLVLIGIQLLKLLILPPLQEMTRLLA